MRDHPSDETVAHHRQIDRAILSELLRNDHHALWFYAELEREITHAEPRDISDALVRLKDDGVVCVSGELVCASRCVLHLHALEVLAI